METIMNQLYSKKSNARRAAVKDLGTHAFEGVDYRLVNQGSQWTWETVGGETEAEAVTAPKNETPTEKPAEKTGSDPSSVNAPRKGSKQSLLIDMLHRPEGATIDQIVEATAWQRHSVRGAISGTVKKKLGLNVTSEKADSGERVYRIIGTA
jgi:hypothetical protein